MGFLWNRRGPRKGQTERPQHHLQLELTPLEERRLLAVTAVTATADPRILPNNGRYVPVTVSGTITQVSVIDVGQATVPPPAPTLAALNAANARKPAPEDVIGFVTDQYREDEPRMKTTDLKQTSSNTFFNPFNASTPSAQVGLVRNYSYSFTFHLQAKASSIGRSYDIAVSSSDDEAIAQKNIAVIVPAHNAHANAASGARGK